MLLSRIVAFVVPLGFDTLAVAVSLGLRGVAPLRPALAFALFEGIMPIAGLVLGHLVGQRFETPAVLAGAVVLIGIGLHALKEALEDGDETAGLAFGSLRGALLAGVAISMDELAVGFPMGTSGLPIPTVIGAIGLQAFVVTLLGVSVGRRIGQAGGKRTTRVAALTGAVAFILLGGYLGVERFVPGLPPL